MKIAILSTTKLPAFLGPNHPDEESLFAKDQRLVAAFVGLALMEAELIEPQLFLHDEPAAAGRHDGLPSLSVHRLRPREQTSQAPGEMSLGSGCGREN